MMFAKLDLSPTTWACMLACSVLLAALPQAGNAGNPLVVNTNSGAAFVPGSNDGLCSLAEALNNANEAGSTATTTFSPDCPVPGATPPLLAPIDIFIQAGIGVINLDGALDVDSPVRLVGPSATDKARITTAGDSGLFKVDQRSIAELNAEIWEFRNLELYGSNIQGSNPGNFSCSVRGGAICASLGKANALLSIIDTEFRQNSTPGNGGALAVIGRFDVDGQRLVIDDSLFEANDAEGVGGGVEVRWADVTVRNSRLTNNNSDWGGAIFARSCPSLSVNGTTFFGNNAFSGLGAALSVDDFISTVITHSRFEQNSGINLSGTSAFNGNVLDFRGSSSQRETVLLLNSELKSNQTGAISLRSGVTATVSSTTIHDNRVRARDFGIFVVVDSVLEMFNASIVDNVGLEDTSGLPNAGVYAARSTVNLEHVTLSGNSGAGSNAVGGLYLVDNSTANVSGTLLADNFALGNGNLRVSTGSVLNLHSSQFGDSASEVNGSNTANVFNDSSGLDPVQDMGCTVLAGDSSAPRCVPLAPLTAGATALDRSDPATVLTSDQRGSSFSRRFGGGNLPDIGAHELQPPIITLDQNTNTAWNEGSSGTTPFPFVFVRNGDTRDISFANWNIFGDGANPAGVDDFTAASWTGGSAFFDVGQKQATANVQVIGDVFAENNEGFRMMLAGITNGVQGSANSRTGTIINDDAVLPAPFVAITPVSVDTVEGNFILGSTQTFRITRSQVIGGLCSFQVELSAIGPLGVDNDDFLNWSLGTITYQMQPGEETFDITVEVRGDGAFEGDEAFRMRLLNPSGCFIDSTASSVDALIIDDESLFSVDATTVAAAEGDSGQTLFSFQINRAGFIDAAASVQWAVQGSGSNPATADDFAGGVFPSGTALYVPNSNSVTIAVPVAGDTLVEPDEQFSVVLGSPQGGEIGTAEVQSTIINDDANLTDEIFADGYE